MSKTAPAKTNGHPVGAINAVTQKAVARPLPKAAAKAAAIRADRILLILVPLNWLVFKLERHDGASHPVTTGLGCG